MNSVLKLLPDQNIRFVCCRDPHERRGVYRQGISVPAALVSTHPPTTLAGEPLPRVVVPSPIISPYTSARAITGTCSC
jgi:hypothetical protein